MVTFDEALSAVTKWEQRPPSLAGPWSLGQVLAHCAQSVEYSLSGFPQPRGWLVRKIFGPRVMRRFLAAGRMEHDLSAPIPGAPPLGPTDTTAGAARLRAAIAAFRAHPGPLAPHFAYGEVTKAEYEALHAMHLADHLSARP